MSIRVLHVISGLNTGGAQVTLKYLIENIDARQFESFFYPLRQKQITIPISGNIIKMPYPNYDPRKLLAILKLSRRYRIDIIHAHLEKAILLSLLASFFCKASVVIHEQGPILYKGLKYSIYRFLLRLLRRRIAIAISISRATTNQLRREGITLKRIRVVPNVVDLHKFGLEHSARDRIRRLIGVASYDIVLGFVGRLNSIKGVDILIESMALLLKKNPHYLLVLIGDGPQGKIFLRLARQLGIAARVKFLGFRNNIAEIMDGFDIVVMPSRQEPFGIVALEAMRKKIPLICSGVEGLGEIAENEVTALVPVENTPQQICRCIERLVTDLALQKKLTENAYRYCEQFSVSNFVNAIQKIYFEIVKHKKAKNV